MVESLKGKLTQENIVIFLYIAMFWASIMESNQWSKGIVIVSVIFGLYTCIKYKDKVWEYLKDSKFVYIFLLFLIPILLSTIDSSALKFSIRADFNMLRFFFVGVLAIFLCQKSLIKIHYLLLLFIIIVSLDATIEWLTGYHLLGVSRDKNRIMGLFGYYHLGYFLATILPVLFFQLLKSFECKGRYRYFWLFILVCSILSIFVAGSRAGWVTLFVSFGLLLVWGILHKIISIKLLGILGLLFIVFGSLISQFPIVKNRYANFSYTNQTELWSYEWFDKFSSNRLVLWEFSWDQYSDNPILGSGVGSFRPIFSAQPAELKNGHDVAYFPHLQGLEVLSETGSFGFIFYVCILLWVLRLIFVSKYFPAWFMITFLAIMPINTHVAFYGSFWAVLIWIPLILGLRERYLLMKKDAENT